jgi:hypothetical protein
VEEAEWESIPRRMEYPLRDGGKVVVPDVKDFADMGDGFAYRRATYHQDGVEIEWEVRNGAPQCTSVLLTGGGLRTKDLQAIKLDDIREIVYSTIGIGTFAGDEEYVMTPSDSRKEVNRAASRRKMTPEFLARVGEIHRRAPEGRRLAAVIAAFDVHERSALRYIAKARDEGYING